jgi:hypothetical protein
VLELDAAGCGRHKGPPPTEPILANANRPMYGDLAYQDVRRPKNVDAGIKPHERALLGAALTRDDESEREHWARWLLGEA